MKAFFYTFLMIASGVLLMAATPTETRPTPSSGAGAPPLQGFKDWKKNQVFDAREALDQFRSPQLAAESGNKKDPGEAKGTSDSAKSAAAPEPSEESQDKLTAVDGKASQEVEGEGPIAQPATEVPLKLASEEQLRQLEFNLEIAQGLTIHDYFALYLKNKSKEEMASAIQKLSPEELSELLVAYRESLYGVPESVKSSSPDFKKNL